MIDMRIEDGNDDGLEVPEEEAIPVLLADAFRRFIEAGNWKACGRLFLGVKQVIAGLPAVVAKKVEERNSMN